MEAAADIKLSRRKLKALHYNPAQSAKAVNLQYISDKETEGIARIKAGNGFTYKKGSRTVKDKATLARIKSLVIPPAWEGVWIAPTDDAHLQVTGVDVKGRKQYRYHPQWNALRNGTKFSNLYEFGLVLPLIRKQIATDLAHRELNLEKVLATVVSLMQCTCIRIGNSAYEKQNGSFGLTTLKDQHVLIKGSKMKFAFKGKKGVYHEITTQNKKLAKIVQACRDIPGKELFQYYSEDKTRKSIDSGAVNGYIKSISGGNFTAKDFRTWAGSLQALQAFKEIGMGEGITDTKKKIVACLDSVASHLGNTRTVCKKYYVHPAILQGYEDGSLKKYLNKLDDDGVIECAPEAAALSPEEKILMQILKK